MAIERLSVLVVQRSLADDSLDGDVRQKRFNDDTERPEQERKADSLGERPMLFGGDQTAEESEAEPTRKERERVESERRPVH
jgi:hypothetical protein